MSQPTVKEFQLNIASEASNICSVYNSSVPNLQPYTNYNVSFVTEFIDNGGWFTSAQPTRLTVPSGVAWAKFTASCGVSLQGSPVQPGMLMVFRLLKNGSITNFIGPGIGVDLSVGIVKDENPTLFTPWIPVAAGDYFELQFYYEKSTIISGVGLIDVHFDVEYMYGTSTTNKGYLWAWGNNTYGQLGTGNTTSYSSPIRVGALNDWIDIRSDDGTVTDGKAVAVRDNGTIWAWGENSNGNVGDGTTSNRSSPTQIGTGTDWTFITENDQSAYAIKTDGSLWAWGRNNNGELGVGNTISYSSPVRVGALNNWMYIDNYDRRTFGIKTDGTLWAWGYNGGGLLGVGNTISYSSPVQVGSLNTWATVVCGVFHTFAIKTDGSLWGWGNGTSGALGLGNTTIYSSPIRVGALNDWAMVSGGINYTLAIKTDGSLWAWGLNSGGQLGTGNTTSYSSPVRVGALNDWKFVDAGDTASAAIKTDGSLWAWADNSYGALGLGDTISRSSPARVGSSNDWITVNTSRSMTLGIKIS